MVPFFERLTARANEIQSLLCVGLDPEPDALGTENCNKQGLFDYCKRIVDATSHITLLYKPNSAFFERFGPAGMEALKEVVDYIHSRPGRPFVLLDGKRGDIDKTATAYAYAGFEAFEGDVATVNGYMGFDTLAPYLKFEEKGIFVLCKTSNPGSNDLQTLRIASTGEQLYEHVARMCVGTDGERTGQVGLVVGATDAEAVRTIRAKYPDVWILAPGVGAQGGDLRDALMNGINKTTKVGILIAVSRQLSKAADPKAEAETIVNETRRILASM